MKILIDGDSCRVISITEQIANKNNIDCHIYCNSASNVKSKYSQIHIVDCSKDAADFAITNTCNENDIVVTNDSGLAAMVLAKKGRVINANGIEYTDSNIMQCLNQRYINKMVRQQTQKQQVKGRLYDFEPSKNYRLSLTQLIKGTI